MEAVRIINDVRDRRIHAAVRTSCGAFQLLTDETGVPVDFLREVRKSRYSADLAMGRIFRSVEVFRQWP